ncbi:FecCD family ABC transporter permease [Campylobacter blaseri]|nr:iron ABC transporter permease [Campylobacter blaseri]
MVFLILDISLGPAKYSFLEVFEAIFGTPKDESISVIIHSMRIPAALMAVVAGASLGLSGAVMQTILSNPLASPYTLGIGSAAGFGAAVGIVLFDGSFLGISSFAFLFSSLSILFIYYLSKRIFLGSSSIILIGIILVFIYQSLQAFVIYLANEIEVSSIVFWTFGSLMRSNYTYVSVLALALILALFIVLYKAWDLNALLLGDEKAASLGIKVDSLKIRMLILVSLLTTICVCFVGTIGFVGLVAAHVSRLLIGAEQRFFLIFSAICGALLLSLSSVFSKSVVDGVVFPIGIITSFIGAIFFLAIVLKKGLR